MDAASWRRTDRTARMRYLGQAGNDRKLLLYSAACCRRIWHLLDDRGRDAVEAAERHADGRVSQAELAEVVRHLEADQRRLSAVHAPAAGGNWAAPRADWHAAQAALLCLAGFADKSAEHAAFAAAATAPRGVPGTQGWATAFLAACRRERRWQKGLVDEVFGDPFRPVAGIEPDWLAWGEGVVRKLAEAIYAGRAFEQLPVLADALEDADCGHSELLAHLRVPGTHVSGCWALDLVLGTA